MLWRGCTRWPLWRDGRTMAIAGGNFAKFVFYPIDVVPGQPGMRLTNWAVMAKTGDSGASPLRPEDWSRPGLLAEVLPFVRNRFRLDFVDPAAIIEATGGFYEYPNCDRDPLPRWSFGRVTLLGDAAHPMYPVGSNGASQAIIDARVLGACLIEHGVGPDALAAYDEKLCGPISELVLRNRGAGPFGLLNMVDKRCGGEFENIDDVIPPQERAAFMAGYKTAAGFAIERLNAAPSTIAPGARLALAV